jgi:hypothetical protein
MSRVTYWEKAGLVYGAWLLICGVAAWFLARWSARRSLNNALFGVLVVIALVNLAQIGYILGFGESLMARPRNPLEKFLQHTDFVWLILYVLWPFATAIGIAQTSLRIAGRPALARWVAFGCSAGIAALTPFILIFVGCGLAGQCF